MAPNTSSRVITALLVAVAIFLIAIILPKYVISGVVPRVATTQGLELFLSLLAIAVLGKRKFSVYGFCRPQASKPSGEGKTRWVGASLWAPLLGMVASPLILGLGGHGNPMIKSLSIPEMILFVWIFSSSIEEVFTRGFLQGHLSVLSGRYLKLPMFRIELPVLISALFFGCMHLSLLFGGVDAITMTVTFLFTFSIGLMAGQMRAKTGSLIPAIVVHMLANLGGALGGIIYVAVSFLITGKMLTM